MKKMLVIRGMLPVFILIMSILQGYAIGVCLGIWMLTQAYEIYLLDIKIRNCCPY